MFNGGDDAVQSEDIPAHVNPDDEEEELISWTGQPKNPHSSVHIDRPVLVTEPVV